MSDPNWLELELLEQVQDTSHPLTDQILPVPTLYSRTEEHQRRGRSSQTYTSVPLPAQGSLIFVPLRELRTLDLTL